MRKLVLITVATGALLGVNTANAEFQFGGRLGFAGIGIEATQRFSPDFAARINLTGLRYNLDDLTLDDVDYDIEQSLAIGSLLLDWHPGSGIFRLTAGAAYYNSIFDMTARPAATTSYQIGNTSYTGAEIGTLNGKVEYRKLTPYVGMGWDFMAKKKSGLGVSVDVGVIFRGEPDDVTLTASGGSATITSANLALEAQNVKDDSLTYHPVVSAGLYYRF
jgi:hypothetical protein